MSVGNSFLLFYCTYLLKYKSLNKISKIDQFSKNKKKTINLLKKISSKKIVIHNDNKKYFSPKTIKELKKVIKKNTNADFLSEGTDL